MRNKKQIVRLTESDLQRLVKRVINEGVCVPGDIESIDELKKIINPRPEFNTKAEMKGVTLTVSGSCLYITLPDGRDLLV